MLEQIFLSEFAESLCVRWKLRRFVSDQVWRTIVRRSRRTAAGAVAAVRRGQNRIFIGFYDIVGLFSPIPRQEVRNPSERRTMATGCARSARRRATTTWICLYRLSERVL